MNPQIQTSNRIAADIRAQRLLKRCCRRRGALTVEVAICLPVLFLFLFGCYEIAHANMLMHATESAAYEAARVGIVPGAKSEKIRNAAQFVLNSVGVNDFTLTITPDPVDRSTEKVKVEIAVPFRGNSSVPRLFVQDPTFRGECELTRETL
jgi:Flp pilus assembly protein TadG